MTLFPNLGSGLFDRGITIFSNWILFTGVSHLGRSKALICPESV